jgi:hypothetical protein
MIRFAIAICLAAVFASCTQAGPLRNFLDRIHERREARQAGTGNCTPAPSVTVVPSTAPTPAVAQPPAVYYSPLMQSSGGCANGSCGTSSRIFRR